MRHLGVLTIRLITSLGGMLGLFDKAVAGALEKFRDQANRQPDTVLLAQQRLQRFVARILFFKLLAGLALLVGSLTHTNPYTPAGHEGYVYERPRVYGSGGFKGAVEGPGNFGLSFFRHEVINVDMRPQTYTEEFKVLTRDDLEISFNFHAVLSIERAQVQQVVDAYGGLDWYGRFLREPFRSFVRDAIQKHRSTDVKSLMGAVSADVERQLKTYVAGSPFQLVGLVAGNIDYPPDVAQAVERKLAAQQLLEEKEVQRQIAQKDVEIDMVRAVGKADAQRIVSATLTPLYLQHQAIEAQSLLSRSSNATTIYIPVANNGLPIVHALPQSPPTAETPPPAVAAIPAPVSAQGPVAEAPPAILADPLSPLVQLWRGGKQQ